MCKVRTRGVTREADISRAVIGPWHMGAGEPNPKQGSPPQPSDFDGDDRAQDHVYLRPRPRDRVVYLRPVPPRGTRELPRPEVVRLPAPGAEAKAIAVRHPGGPTVTEGEESEPSRLADNPEYMFWVVVLAIGVAVASLLISLINLAAVLVLAQTVTTPR